MVFDNFSDGVEAVRSYNGKRAAGQQMVLTIENDNPNLRDRIDRRSVDKRWKKGGNSSRTAKPSAQKPAKRPKFTAEELDAELDAYMGNGEEGN